MGNLGKQHVHFGVGDVDVVFHRALSNSGWNLYSYSKPANPCISIPRISQENKQYYKSRIRSIPAQDHQITQRALQERLKAEGLDLDGQYLASLLNAIYAERTKRLDTVTLTTALAAFQDVMTEVVSKAWEIVNDPMAERNEVLSALREIRAAHNDVFDKLFDAGVFERNLGTLDARIRNAPLPDDKKRNIREVLGNWGLLAPRRRMQNQKSQLQVRSEIDALFESFEAPTESRKSLLGFSLVYLTGYFTDPPALFHPQLIHALESETDRRVLILGFRGSGNSTFGSLALPLWAALEYPENRLKGVPCLPIQAQCF